MSPEQFEKALRAFLRRRPFRPFIIEFMSGNDVRVTHPEVVFPVADLWAHVTGTSRRYRVFAAGSVCQLLDPPGPSEA